MRKEAMWLELFKCPYPCVLYFWGNRGNKGNRLRSNAENVAFFVTPYAKYVSYLLPRICRCKAVVSRVPLFLREEAIL